MGTAVCIDVRGSVPRRGLDEVFGWLREVEETFSTYRPDSEITRLDLGRLCAEAASTPVQEVLALCALLRARTRGFFDARASGRLDPSGVVKGWAVERAAEILGRAGAQQFHISVGGDVVLRGGDAWRVGIQHPLQRERLACVVEIGDGAIATSGAYERGEHIVDPHSRRPPRGVLSVTMLGPDLATTDAYATAAFAMGRDGPRWTASLVGYEAMTILEDRRVLCTPGFLRHCPGGSPAASLRTGCDAAPALTAPGCAR